MALLTQRGIDKKSVKISVTPGVTYTEDQLRVLLTNSDTNNDGKLSKQELKEIFNKLGSHLPGYRVGRALHHADKNGDGNISKEEFDNLVNYILKHNYKTPKI